MDGDTAAAIGLVAGVSGALVQTVKMSPLGKAIEPKNPEDGSWWPFTSVVFGVLVAIAFNLGGVELLAGAVPLAGVAGFIGGLTAAGTYKLGGDTISQLRSGPRSG